MLKHLSPCSLETTCQIFPCCLSPFSAPHASNRPSGRSCSSCRVLGCSQSPACLAASDVAQFGSILSSAFLITGYPGSSCQFLSASAAIKGLTARLSRRRRVHGLPAYNLAVMRFAQMPATAESRRILFTQVALERCSEVDFHFRIAIAVNEFDAQLSGKQIRGGTIHIR